MILILFYFLFSSSFVQADSSLSYQLKQADFLYLKGQYYESKKIYKSLLKNNPIGEVYYNLGTCELMEKDFISALIHLKKAEILLPFDQDIKNNIKFLEKKLDVSNEESKKFLPFTRSFLVSVLSLDLMQFFLLLIWIMCSSFMIYYMLRVKRIHKGGGILLIITLALFLLPSILKKGGDFRIVAEESPILLYNAPDSSSSSVGEIRKGYIVQLLKESQDWLLIKKGDLSGWILLKNKNKLRKVDVE